MKLRVVTLLLVALTVAGCAPKRKTVESAQLRDAVDITDSQYKEVDLATASEVDLVEDLHMVRADYRRLLEILAQWYHNNGYYDKAEWADKELHDFLRIRTYNYLTPIDVVVLPEGPASMVIAEAEVLYSRAQELRKEGEILPLIYNKEKLKEALDLYRKLVREYPTSILAPDAAYYAAEILKEYFQENIQALEYYKLALKLNPNIRRKVRFQMAVLYDGRLHNRSEALKMFRAVLEHEADIDRTNTHYATRRIAEITKLDKKPTPAE